MKDIRNNKSSILWKQCLLIGLLFVIYAISTFMQLYIVENTNIDLRFMILIVIFLNIFLGIRLIQFGIKYFNGNSALYRGLSIVFGLSCYLCIMSQFGLIYFNYYIYYDGFGVIPYNIIVMLKENQTTYIEDIRIVLNYVFPNFYKFPTAHGIVVVSQYFIAKFTDLFVLAFIVDKIKKR